MAKRVILIVLDSVGIGELPDARLYGDQGSNTVGNIAQRLGNLSLPHLETLGFSRLVQLGHESAVPIIGAHGKMNEVSPGKDTTTGHWEIAGIILDKPFPLYPQGFPSQLIKEFERLIGTKVIGNITASGTEIIKKLGEEHLRTGFPIVYTSADSVFQIACHEEKFGLANLYHICTVARDLLQGEHAVGRVIARPFIGENSLTFTRTSKRRDYSLPPPAPTVLDNLKQKGYSVIGIGKIEDIFAGQGLTESIHSRNNREGIALLLDTMSKITSGLIFINLLDFDMIYGHRNNVEGYAQALKEMDQHLPKILQQLEKEDILIITADHGCDPTTPSTDHSREYVPLLVYTPRMKKEVDLGTRKTFADVGKTIADYFEIEPLKHGNSFLKDIL